MRVETNLHQGLSTKVSKRLYLKGKWCYKCEYSYSNHQDPFIFLFFFSIRFIFLRSTAIFLKGNLKTLHFARDNEAMLFFFFFFFFLNWSNHFIFSSSLLSLDKSLSPLLWHRPRDNHPREEPPLGQDHWLCPILSLTRVSASGKIPELIHKGCTWASALRCLDLYPGSPLRSVWAWATSLTSEFQYPHWWNGDTS